MEDGLVDAFTRDFKRWHASSPELKKAFNSHNVANSLKGQIKACPEGARRHALIAECERLTRTKYEG
jgi:hypothetical protein